MARVGFKGLILVTDRENAKYKTTDYILKD